MTKRPQGCLVIFFLSPLTVRDKIIEVFDGLSYWIVLDSLNLCRDLITIVEKQLSGEIRNDVRFTECAVQLLDAEGHALEHRFGMCGQERLAQQAAKVFGKFKAQGPDVGGRNGNSDQFSPVSDAADSCGNEVPPIGPSTDDGVAIVSHRVTSPVHECTMPQRLDA
jgi:hypothetical protein